MATTTTITRGEMITSQGGAAGLYVGEHKGLVVICYEPAGFEAMCLAFDKWTK